MADAIPSPTEPLIAGERAPVRADDTTFVPRGAVAFFAAMLVLFGAVWLALYALMIHRH